MLDFCRAEGVHIEGDVFASFAIAVAFEGAHLVEGDAQVRAAEGFVLIEFQPVLIIEVERPKLSERHGEINFIGRIQPGEDGMGGLNEAPDPFRVAGELRDGERVTDGRQIGMVHRLVRLGLDRQADLPLVPQHLVQGLYDEIHAAPAVLRFAKISPFARQPQHD